MEKQNTQDSRATYDLARALEAFSIEAKASRLTVDMLKKDIEKLKGEKVSLQGELVVLKAKRDTIVDDIREERKNQIKEIDRLHAEAEQHEKRAHELFEQGMSSKNKADMEMHRWEGEAEAAQRLKEEYEGKIKELRRIVG